MNIQKQNMGRSRINRQQVGFTLIEILVAIALIGIMATIVVPSLSRFSPRYERDQFIQKLQALVQFGWQSALSSGKIHRIHFDFLARKISLAVATDSLDAKGEPEFKPAKLVYTSSSISWPSNIQIKNFILEGFDEMSRSGTRATSEAWFYIMPEGLTQSLTINFIDTKQVSPGGKPKMVGLVLSPFNAVFKVYDNFQ